MLFKFNLLNY